MSGSFVTPTEALLQVAQQHPFLPAVKCGENQWSYAALWARVRQIADKIADLDNTRNPIGLHMGLEIDYVAAAHAVWLTGRTVVFLSSKWTPEVLQVVLERANVHLVLFGSSEPPTVPAVRAVSTFNLVGSQQPPSDVTPPSASEAVEVVPLISSITPTSGSTGVPKSIVYPMRRSLEVLSEESSTLLEPMDGQWLRGGTTFLRPLFEIRRFMFNKTTLYLDPSCSVADQCTALCEELESKSNTQLLRVHFTPSVFRAFADFAQMRAGGAKLPSGFNRIYWMVIGGESLSIRDLELARVVFPSATIACNYACSEVGFAGISQMFIRPTDVMPSVISFGPTQGCTDLVLLDQSLSVIPKTQEGATGIVGFITSQSATHYLDNEDASRHMFRPWNGSEMLLYTDDIGCMQADGTIAIRGRSSRNVKINGLFIDLDYVERALAPAFADKSLDVTSFKLVKSNATEKIVLFACTQTAEAMLVLRHARDNLRVSLNDDLSMVIGSVRCIPEMPFNASYKIDLAQLQKLADSTEVVAPSLSADAPATTSADSKVDALAEEIAAEIAQLYKSSEPIPIDMPLLYSGLNSITVVRLYFWLQSEFEYEEEMTHLFEEDVTAEALALEILGDELDEEEESDDEDELSEVEGVENGTFTLTLDKDSDYADDVHEIIISEKDSEYPIQLVQPKGRRNAAHLSVESGPLPPKSPYGSLFPSWVQPDLPPKTPYDSLFPSWVQPDLSPKSPYDTLFPSSVEPDLPPKSPYDSLFPSSGESELPPKTPYESLFPSWITPVFGENQSFLESVAVFVAG